MSITIPKRAVGVGITPTPEQPGRISTAGAIGRAVQTVGQTAAELGGVGIQLREQEKKRKAQLAVALEKEREVNDRATATDRGTVDKGAINEYVNGLKGRSLEAAKNSTLEFREFSRGVTSKGMLALENDNQKVKYQSDMDVFLLDLNNTVMTHERTETKKGYNTKFTASADLSVKLGIDSFDNPNTHTISEDNIEEMAASMQHVNDWDKDTTELWKAEKLSLMYDNIVKQWTVRDVDTGKLSFDVNKDKIDPTRHAEIHKLFDTENANQKGKELYEEIIGKTDDFNEQKALAQSEKDAGVSDNAYTRVVNKNKEDKENARNDARIADDEILKDAYTIRDDKVVNGESEAMRAASGASSGAERNKLEKNIKEIFKSPVAKPTVTDDKHLVNAYDNVENQAYQSLEALRRDTVGWLSPADQKEIENHWQAGGLLGGLKDSDLKKKFSDFYLLAKDDPPEENKKTAKLYMQYRRFIEKQINTLPPGTKNITDTDLNKWSAQAFIEVAVPGSVFGTNKKILIEALSNDLEIVAPEELEADIIRRLEEIGSRTEPEDINEYYRMKIKAE